MIISKDLFIFGEQIFGTIIPEIGTPNSAATTASAAETITLTPPTTPTSLKATTNEELQKQNTNQAINLNACTEIALKVAAKTAVATTTTISTTTTPATTTASEVKATEQVYLKPISKTGTINAINKKTKLKKTTTIPTTATATAITTTKPKFQEETFASVTTHQKQSKDLNSSVVAIAIQKKTKIQKFPKDKKFPKTEQEQKNSQNIKIHTRKYEKELEQVKKETITSGNLQKIEKKFKQPSSLIKLIVKEQTEQQQQEQQQQQQENLSKFNEVVEEALHEKEPLVNRNSIKINDLLLATTKPAITKNFILQKQELLPTDDSEEFLNLLLSKPPTKPVEKLPTQLQLQVAYQPNCNQTLECRLQLEEPLELTKQYLPVKETALTTNKHCFSSSSSTSSAATITPLSTATTTTAVTTKMGKVLLSNNTSSGVSNNTTSARNDHTMVTLPFLSDYHRTLQLTFQNITVLHNERKILSDVSGLVSPGEVLAIMGPSGSGKTTLLDCISGQRRFDSGSIYLNREPISKKWRRKICYVLQEEVFFSGLTLRETVMYTALLRLPEKMPKSEKVKLVDRILQTLELNCCQQTKFGDYLNRGLSGGEKKRANIACELLTNPLLMLLDEPTSGLDSHSAISLMKVLKRYAMQEQKTIVITVHQPSSQMFHMFDKLLLLYNGRTAYFGEVKNIYSYFEDIGVAIKPHYNPADFVLEQLKSYPDIREKLFIAAKESHGNFLNRNCITYNNSKQTHHQQITTTPQHHINQAQNGLTITATNGNSDKSQNHDALINNIINNYYKDISSNNHHHHNHHHINHPDSPMLLIGDSGENHHDNCEDPAQKLWCAKADSQSNFSSSSSDYHQYESNGDDWLDYPTRFHTQFRVLLSRNFKEAKPIMLSKLNWFQTIGLALMAGAIWFQLPRTEEFLHDLQGWMFFSQTYWMLFALFGALNSFPSEREVISKERRSGAYRLSAYYLAKMFGELPLVVTLPTVYLIISYPMLGCASLKLFFLMLVFLLLNTMVAQSVGFFIGACCMDMNVSITLSALYTLATQLFGGYLSSRIPDGLSWIRYTSMIHYAYQNMQILEFHEGPAISCGNPSSFEICKSNTTSFIPYEEILKAQNSNSPLWLNTLVLMMFFLVFRVLGYAVLRYIRCPKT